MKYTKPPLTLEQQADLLLSRGMSGDRDLMIERLGSVNYYRLSGYWFPFRNPDDDCFKLGTSFDTIWNRYVFDRHLRLLVMDAIQRIEIAVRTRLAHHHSLSCGAFAYATDPASLPKLSLDEHARFLERVNEETKRSREIFIEHFRKKYGTDHPHLPVWMATEVMTFGTMLTFFRGASHKIKQGIASVFGIPSKVLDSWLLTLNTIRNICAHHGRLWNRELGVKPLVPLPAPYPDWHTPVPVRNTRMFAVLTICRYSLSHIAPQSGWPDRVRSLLAGFPEIPLASMGFPGNWYDCPVWRNARDSNSLGR